MDADIGLLGPPRMGFLVEVFHVPELPSFEEVVFDVVEGSFHLAVSFLFAGRQDNDPEAICIGKLLEHGVDPDL